VTIARQSRIPPLPPPLLPLPPPLLPLPPLPLSPPQPGHAMAMWPQRVM